MHAASTKKHPKLYGYKFATNQNQNDADMKLLYGVASGAKNKLLIVGGVHGYTNTGEPTGQANAEKVGVESFAMMDKDAKSVGKGINFTYKNLAKYTSNGSDVTLEKQQEVTKLIKDHLDSGDWYVLLSWCYSRVWATAQGL